MDPYVGHFAEAGRNVALSHRRALAPEDGAGDRAVEFATNEVSYLRIDATKPPLDDIRGRRAVNYAIDREGLTTAVFAGRPSGQLVSKGVTG
ncbi:hypothetical protein GCM10010103_57680 [Streptomyces paradoxus]